MVAQANDSRRLPPLVAPGPPLDPEESVRYSRQLLLPAIGLLGQRRLRAARILVVGAGGLGSPALLYLAGAGIGTLGIVDADVVDESNLQRQVVHSTATVGEPKTASAARALRELNPGVTVIEHRVVLDSSNALELFSEYDLVLDGSDNFPTRYLVADAAALRGVPVVWGSVLRFDGQLSVFWSTPPAGIEGVGYRDLFPDPPPPGTVPDCAEGGVLGALCGVIGAGMATEAIKLVTGAGESLLGRLQSFDALSGRWHELRVERDPELEPAHELIDYEAFCGLPAGVDDAGRSAGGGDAAASLVSARELHELLSAAASDVTEAPLVIDVREDWEVDIAAIPGARHVPLGSVDRDESIAALARDTPIVLYCKAGVRSTIARESLEAAGFTELRELEGGILSWIDEVEPALPRY